MKLLFLDIETSPAVVYTWDLFKPHISVDQIITPTSLLCFSARWHDEEEVQFFSSKKRSGPEFDKMIRAAHRLLSAADAICHYNGISFDIPRLNQEFLRLGLAPPPPTAQIDLKKVVMTKFGMISSKLAFVGPYLEIGEKIRHEGWPLWIDCLANEKDAWRKMEAYNRQDVVLLAKLYEKLLPWIDGHPNMNLFVDDGQEIVLPRCKNCGSEKIRKQGFKRTSTNVYQQVQCCVCGTWARFRTVDKNFPKVQVR